MKDYCQNPLCYQYTSKDRLRGVKGSKVYQNRTISTYAYGDRNFCTLHCQTDYLDIYMNRFIDYRMTLHDKVRQSPYSPVNN